MKDIVGRYICSNMSPIFELKLSVNPSSCQALKSNFSRNIFSLQSPLLLNFSPYSPRYGYKNSDKLLSKEIYKGKVVKLALIKII